MNQLQQVFQFGMNQVRTVVQGEEIFFVAKDVAEVLGYTNPQKAIRDHCKRVNETFIPTNGGDQLTKVISERDVYRLVMRSKLPSAEKFEEWIVSEVLPSIRKHGGYLTPEKVEEALLNPDTLIRLATNLKVEQEKRLAAENMVLEKNKVIATQYKNLQEQRPKVIFADAVGASRTSILVGELAKLLKQNGIETGQKRLFHWLRDNGYLIRRKGTDFNMPTQRSMEMGLFEIKETSITHNYGHISISKTPKVSGKGQVYFINKLIAAEIKTS
ncbi:phage antirepressor [Sutcliffiella horikoshii]|uniref:phage antirepressor n=1 Tax=Sutcliffiella horikoshii TaxID=79883 RepID=UPI001CBBCB1F|nr:phage antirepressor KilAC domain-containing protein [Sutcliffiella horikoshii]UAL46832.1 phage antirepressor [Sutcliffiella horikoshii]